MVKLNVSKRREKGGGQANIGNRNNHRRNTISSGHKNSSPNYDISVAVGTVEGDTVTFFYLLEVCAHGEVLEGDNIERDGEFRVHG